MKIKLIIAVLFVAGVGIAQDVAGFLPMNNLLSINPSFAGSNGGLRAQANYVNNWPSLSGRRVSYSLAADMAVNDGKSGLAIYANRANYVNGLQINNNIGVGYAHRFSIANGSIKIIPSAQLGLVNVMVDKNSGWFIVPPSSTPAYVSKNNMEINTGVLVQVKENLSAGVSAFHVNTPDVGVFGASKLGARTVLHASYNLIKEQDHVINLYGSYTYQFGFDNVTLACSAIFKKHYYIVLSGIHETFSNAGTVGFGWRSDLWSATFAWQNSLIRGYGTSAGSYQLACSFSMRGKAHLHGISALENW